MTIRKPHGKSKVALIIGLFIFMVVVAVVIFFSSKEKQPIDNKDKIVSATLDKVSLRLRWLTQSQFAGLYWAKEKGLFAKEGLDVTINPGGPGINFMQIVGSGAEHFGICSAPQIIESRAKGVPVVALAVIFQGNPIIFFSKKDSGIESPSDWSGKSVAVFYGFAQEYVYKALVAKAGIDPKAVKEYPAKFDMTPFYRDEVDVWSGYVINQPNTAEEQGFSINRIFPDDYSVQMAGDTLFTTEKLIRDNPDLVRRMVRAVLSGWHESLKNEEESVRLVLSMDPKLNEVHETKMIEWVKKLTLTEEINGRIGWTTSKQWQDMITLWREYGGLVEDVKPEDCFDLRFIEEYYKQ